MVNGKWKRNVDGEWVNGKGQRGKGQRRRGNGKLEMRNEK
jgi:hypothetical protein